MQPLMLDEVDFNRLGIDVNAAIAQGRSNGKVYIHRWYRDCAVEAEEFWNRTYAWCVSNDQPFVPSLV